VYVCILSEVFQSEIMVNITTESLWPKKISWHYVLLSTKVKGIRELL